MIGWVLGIHGREVTWNEKPPRTPAPGVVFRTRTIPRGPKVVAPSDARYRIVAANRRWNVLTVPPAGEPRSTTSGCPSAPGAPTAPRGPDTPDLSSAALGG